MARGAGQVSHRTLANGAVAVATLRWVSVLELLPPKDPAAVPDDEEVRAQRYLDECYSMSPSSGAFYFTPETSRGCKLCSDAPKYDAGPSVTDGTWWFAFEIPHLLHVHRYTLPERVLEDLRSRDFVVPSLETELSAVAPEPVRAWRPPPRPISLTVAVPRGIRTAAVLSWTLGILFLSSAVALGIPAVALHGVFSKEALLPSVAGVVAVAHFFAGYGMPRRDREAGRTAIAVGLLSLLAPAAFRIPILYVGAVINLVIVVLTARDWYHFETGTALLNDR